MTTRRNSPIKPRDFLIPVLSSAVLSYFVYHMFVGDRGFLALIQTKRDLELVEIKLSSLEKIKKDFEQKNSLLNSAKGIDLDLLDEQARRMLLLVKSDEFLVPLGRTNIKP